MRQPPGGEAQPKFEDGWRERFREFAELHDDDAGIAGWSATGLDARVRRFLQLWTPAAARQRWLDAGCGAGTYSRILLGQGFEVVGVDYSLPALRKAITRDLDAAMLAVADVRRLPFRPHAFDGVICFGVTQALVESSATVRELASQVKPDGELWLDALNRWCLVHAYEILRRRFQGRGMHLRYESPLRIKRLLADHDFGKVELHWMPILPARLQRWQALIEARPVTWVLKFVPLFGLLFSHAFVVRARKQRV